MDNVHVTPIYEFDHRFVPAELLPPGEDEYYLRNAQNPKPAGFWRNLRADEIEVLVKNANAADDWDNLLVTDRFSPRTIKNCEFAGLVRIGRLDSVMLTQHDLHVPAGLTNSRIVACDIGDNSAVHNVPYLAHYIVGDRCMLLNIDEMHCTNHAKFGNGIVTEGEDEGVRVWMDLMNEIGTRRVAPFDGMTCGDAWLWAKFRHDEPLMQRLKEITQKQFDPRRGHYGLIAEQCVIKNCRIIKDVKFGPGCYIKGANKLKNLTINSSLDEPTQIGEGVELVNGIIGRGCRVFYGCKAIRFVMGMNSSLKYGARLIHSYLGDNSTVSCCEILNNLLFPAHEQHHNNSFLVAALVKGQSNIAAGATLGSNHNSRANDGEIVAGRGFWPGLCTTIKHPCRFASFTLLAKGDYPNELNNPLPFALLSHDAANDRLLVMPAYWWMYNMYALARNAWKFQARDNRMAPVQHVEYDALAPDTVEEIFAARDLLALWTARAAARAEGGNADDASRDDLIARGRAMLREDGGAVDRLTVLGEGIERGGRDVVVLKPRRAENAYRHMLIYYSMRNVLDYLAAHPNATWSSLADALGGGRVTEWSNMGGQLVKTEDLERLRADIRDGRLVTWPAIHEVCDTLWRSYSTDKQRHAFASLKAVLGIDELTEQVWSDALDEAVAIQRYISDAVYQSRRKDYDDPFRQITFDSPEEMRAVVGSADENSFVDQVREETEAFERQVDAIRSRE